MLTTIRPRIWYIQMNECADCEHVRMCIINHNYGIRLCRGCITEHGGKWAPETFTSDSFWQGVYDYFKEKGNE